MISFKLHCDHSHEFEGWFSSSADFDNQQEAGLLSCPVCASSSVQKSLMAPAVSTSRKKQTLSATQAGVEGAGMQSQSPSSAVAMPLAGSSVPLPPDVVDKIREFRRHVLASSENVGERFPEEARKIHYGETEQKAIVGKASLKDVAELTNEGIELFPLPELPEDNN